ncbi:hypothetical protein RHGRI_009797 [Rhododendron griersonianum]|uniref:Sodium/metabolite cotransporter BASS1, chloroplastic n=1 Tax=Rhododendron griersonianum TaxID=479676 RepID=A0AAV6KGS1_9ERIC|nr:hypothetical protein RHGRI_009797 [Rhododendron griersonianum]
MQSSLSSIHGKRIHISTPIPKPNSPPQSRKSLLHLPHLPFSPSRLSIRSHQIKPQSLQTHSNPPFHSPIRTPNPNQPIIPSPRPRKSHPLPPLLCGISSNTLNADGGGRGFRGWIEAVGEAVSTAFSVWVALGCLVGLLKPGSYNWVKPEWTIMGITVTMLGMGMTLTFDDLRGALAMPKELITGFVLQYSVMPLSAYFVSKFLRLPSYYAAGLILVGCCPGGTARVLIILVVSSGNVALSVLMTAASTLSAVVGKSTLLPYIGSLLIFGFRIAKFDIALHIMTPFLTAKLAGQFVAVDAVGLLMSTLQVVLLPVLAGAFLNQYFQSLVKFVSPLMPPIAVATVAVLCGKAIAQSASAILTSGGQVVLAAALLHASGFFFGYMLSRMLGLDVSSSRTISIEVGMQNSVLGVVLATQHFGNPLTAVPCAVSSVCHSIFGSALAGIWRCSIPESPKQDKS